MLCFNLVLPSLFFKSQENRRIVRSIGDDDDDEDFDDLEALRLAALKSLGTKVSKGFILEVFFLNLFTLCDTMFFYFLEFFCKTRIAWSKFK